MPLSWRTWFLRSNLSVYYRSESIVSEELTHHPVFVAGGVCTAARVASTLLSPCALLRWCCGRVDENRAGAVCWKAGEWGGLLLVLGISLTLWWHLIDETSFGWFFARVTYLLWYLACLLCHRESLPLRMRLTSVKHQSLKKFSHPRYLNLSQ